MLINFVYSLIFACFCLIVPTLLAYVLIGVFDIKEYIAILKETVYVLLTIFFTSFIVFFSMLTFLIK